MPSETRADEIVASVLVTTFERSGELFNPSTGMGLGVEPEDFIEDVWENF